MENQMTPPLSYLLFAYWHDPRWKRFVGASVKIWDMARNLSASGNDVVLFLPRSRFPRIKAPFAVIEIPVLNIPGLRSLSYNFFLFGHLIRHWRKYRPQIVYLRRTSLFVPLLYARLVKALFFFEVNDDPYEEKAVGSGCRATVLRGKLSVAVDELNLRFADRVFVISDPVIEKIARRNPALPADRLLVMPSGANTDLLRPMEKGAAADAVGLDRSRPYVGFVGTFLAHQGVDVLIRAAASVARSCPECRFVVIGEGPMKDQWRKTAGRIGVETKFLFPGQIPYSNLPEWIGAMDICVAPYRKSAGLRSPVKIFDYLACGKPVVASLIDGSTDVFRESNAVIFVPPENDRRLAEEITALLDDPDKRRRMGENGRAFILAKYDRRFNADLISREAKRMLLSHA